MAWPIAVEVLVEQRLQTFCIHGVAVEREMDVIRSEEWLLEGAIGVDEIAPQVQHMHLWIAVEVQCIKRGIGLPKVLAEGIAGGVAWQDFRRDELRVDEIYGAIHIL